VRDAEINEALDRAAGVPRALPGELLKRIGESIEPTLAPVRPLPASWLLAGALVAIGAVVALVGAARAGFQGFSALGPAARVAIFAALAILAGVTAAQLVAEWIPGSRRRLTPAGLLTIASVTLLGVFALLFHDYPTVDFVAAGLRCLFTGLAHAVPAAFLGWWVLRRGWVTHPVAAGLAAGVLAGLAGVAMLELHCANFEALHVLVWHTLVVPVSGLAGAIVGWALRGCDPWGGAAKR
jgi:hypothetical protein